MLNPGIILQNRYHVVRPLGGGGMGIVYLAEDTRLPGRRCAIKEMTLVQVLPQDRNWTISAFKQEAQMLAFLRHPGLTSVTDFFTEGGNWYLVMDYVEGETLETWLQRSPEGKLSLSAALDIVRQLCDVLEYLHSQNPPVIFRDLKPGNVMLTPQGQIKLIDFGIARFFKPGKGSDTVNLGTPGYAAPEQGGRGQTDARSDIYSLGVLLHQMMTGYDPAATPFNLPDVDRFGTPVPPEVVEGIRRAILTDPNARFASIAEMRATLYGRPRTVPAPPGPARSPGNRSWVWVGGIALALLALIVVMALYSSQATRNVQATATGGTGSTAAVLAQMTATGQALATANAQAQATSTAPAMASARPLATMPSPAQATASAQAPVATAQAPAIATVSTQATALAQSQATIAAQAEAASVPTWTPKPACSPVTGPFATLWSSVQTRLGCASGSALGTWMAEEEFQRGIMFWRQDNTRIYALVNGAGWSDYPDTWREGDPESSCSGGSPLTPIRGFGKVWCTVSAVRNGLGGATAGEVGYNGTVQDFQRGVIIRTDGGATYVLYSDGGWENR